MTGAALDDPAHDRTAGQEPLCIDVASVPLERAASTAYGAALGTLGWRRVFCADHTDTEGAVLGVAEFAPGETLLPHRHPPAEYYFGLSGQGTVTVDGVAHDLRTGVALFIPGDVVHGVVAGPEGLRFLYVFPRDRMSEVAYQFTGQFTAQPSVADGPTALAKDDQRA